MHKTHNKLSQVFDCCCSYCCQGWPKQLGVLQGQLFFHIGDFFIFSKLNNPVKLYFAFTHIIFILYLNQLEDMKYLNVTKKKKTLHSTLYTPVEVFIIKKRKETKLNYVRTYSTFNFNIATYKLQLTKMRMNLQEKKKVQSLGCISVHTFKIGNAAILNKWRKYSNTVTLQHNLMSPKTDGTTWTKLIDCQEAYNWLIHSNSSCLGRGVR